MKRIERIIKQMLGIKSPSEAQDEAWFGKKTKNRRCVVCRWYIPENGCCQIKKCSGRGGPGYITRRDGKHCKGFEPLIHEKIEEMDKTLQSIRDGSGLDPLPRQVEEDPGLITLYADNVPFEVLTPNEIREAHGCKPVWKGPLPEPRIEEYGTIEHWDGKTTTKLKRCEYCGCFSSLIKGTCEHCGAPL